LLLGGLKLAGAVAALFALASAGVSFMASGLQVPHEEVQPQSLAGSSSSDKDQTLPLRSRVDQYDDSLPDGAVMRLGTIRRRAVGAKLAVSADGQSIIGVRSGKYVSVWDAATGNLRHTHQLASHQSNLAALSADGCWLATDDSQYGKVMIWDLRNGNLARTLELPDSQIIQPGAFSADGRYFAAVGGKEGRRLVRAWHVDTGKVVFTKQVPGSWSGNGIAFSADAKRLLASFASENEGLFCWDLATGKQVWQRKAYAPVAMVLTPDAKILSTVAACPLLDLAAGEPAEPAKLPHYLAAVRYILTIDQRTLLLSTSRGLVIWDLQNGKELRNFGPTAEEVVLAPDGKTVVTSNGALQRWDLATGKPLHPDNIRDGHIGEVIAVAYSGDGKRAASASVDGSVRVWDTGTGKPLHVWPASNTQRPVPVTAVDVTADGRSVLYAAGDDYLRLRDATTGKEIRQLALPPREAGEGERLVYQLRLSQDGTRAVAMFGFGNCSGVLVQLPPDQQHKMASWDLKTGRMLSCFSIEMSRARESSIAADGRTALVNGLRFDVLSGKEMIGLEGARQGLWGFSALASSVDSMLAAGGFADITKKDGMTYIAPGGIRLWEVATGKTIAQLKTKHWPDLVAFRPGGEFVAFTDMDGVHVWELSSGKVVLSRPLHDRVRSNVAMEFHPGSLLFTPDGRFLSTAHGDGTILLWDLSLPRREMKRLSTSERNALWGELAGADASRAWSAVWRLSSAPTDSLALFRERLKPVLPAQAEGTAQLVADLDSPSFPRREESMKRLRELGPRAEARLRSALRGNLSAEQKRRIKELLSALESMAPPTGEELRELRAIAALARLDSPQARMLLSDLSKGVESAHLTRAARAALRVVP
jgi:WD40 repeat protein